MFQRSYYFGFNVISGAHENALAPVSQAGDITFGDKETCNLVIQVSDGNEVSRFHCHWEVLSSNFPLFAAMKRSQMQEAVNNLVKFTGNSLAWRVIYVPFEEFNFDDAVVGSHRL